MMFGKLEPRVPQAQGLGFVADLLSTDIGDAAVHVASAAAAVSWVQEQAQRRFTAAAFQTLAKDGSTGSCPAGFGIEQDYRMYKEYSFQLKSIWSTFTPKHLALVYGKYVALNSLMSVNMWLWHVMEAEEAAQELEQRRAAGIITDEEEQLQATQIPPFPDLTPVFPKSVVSGIRDVITTTMRRIYEHLAAAKLGRRTAWKLLKDFKASVARKAEYHVAEGLASRWLMYSKTVGQGTALMYAAECTVSLGYSAVTIARSKGPSRAQKARQLGTQAGLHLVRVTTTWTVATMGAATAAVLVRPSRAGWAASSGQFLTDFVAGTLISMVLFGMLPSVAAQQQEEEEQQGMVPNVVA